MEWGGGYAVPFACGLALAFSPVPEWPAPSFYILSLGWPLVRPTGLPCFLSSNVERRVLYFERFREFNFNLILTLSYSRGFNNLSFEIFHQCAHPIASHIETPPSTVKLVGDYDTSK